MRILQKLASKNGLLGQLLRSKLDGTQWLRNVKHKTKTAKFPQPECCNLRSATRTQPERKLEASPDIGKVGEEAGPEEAVAEERREAVVG